MKAKITNLDHHCKLSRQIGKKLDNKLYSQLYSQLGILGTPLWNKISLYLYSQLWSQLGSQLEIDIDSKLKTKNK